MNRLRLRPIAVAAALLVAAISFGAESLLQRSAQEIASPNIALDLGLTATQKTDRDKLFAEYQLKRDSVVPKTDVKTDQADALNAEIAKLLVALDTKLLALLTEHQRSRLLQIAIQEQGVNALLDDAVAKQVGLTPAQRGKVKVIVDGVAQSLEEYQTAVGEALSKLPDPASDKKADIEAYEKKQVLIIQTLVPQKKIYENIKASGDKQVLALLTPVQRKKWDGMQGKPVRKGA